MHLSEFASVCATVRKVCWTSLPSGRSPHDGGQRFFTLALSWKSYGFSDYCKADVCTINVLVAVVESRRIILHLFLRDRYHHYALHVRPSYYHTICHSTCFNGCAAVLLLHLLALLLATVDVLWFHAC